MSLPLQFNLKESIHHGDALYPIAVHHTINNADIKPMLYTHWHDEIELLYIENGEMNLSIGSHTMLVSKGDCVLITPNILHGATSHQNSPCTFYAIVFHPEFISSSGNDYIQQRFISPYLTKTEISHYISTDNRKDHSLILSNVETIIKSDANRQYCYQLTVKSALLTILSSFIANNLENKDSMNRIEPLKHIRMKKILTFLEENYQQRITLADWSSNLSLSREQFTRLFKEYFNQSPIEYLINYRIRRATWLLLHTKMPIIEIALDTGFESANYFTITFKKVMNTTPKAYRENYRES